MIFSSSVAVGLEYHILRLNAFRKSLGFSSGEPSPWKGATASAIGRPRACCTDADGDAGSAGMTDSTGAVDVSVGGKW